MTKVLILDANQRSALATIRSLGLQKNLVIYSADSTEKSLGGSSQFCKYYHQHPSLNDNPLDFLSWLQDFICANKLNLVFPMTEISSQLLLMNKEILGKAKIPFAPFDTIMGLADKGHLTQLAKQISIPTPGSILYPNAAAVNLNENYNYPLVIKPCLSRIWLSDHWLHTSVQIVQHKEELLQNLKDSPWLRTSPFMLQEYIPGYGAGLFALYNRGKPITFFSHKRLREKPPEGGVSVLSESVALDPVLLNYARKLLDTAKWHGVAMVEFRVADDGTPYLMEVNTRFWGSLQLAIDAGVDFPKLLYQITIGELVETVDHYKQGVRLRWLLGDLDSLYLVLKNPNISIRKKLTRAFAFLTPNFFSTHHEINRWGDLKPAVTELKQYIQNVLK